MTIISTGIIITFKAERSEKDAHCENLGSTFGQHANECGPRKHGPCISPQLQMTSLKNGFDQATRF